jgi:hypothetical protein
MTSLDTVTKARKTLKEHTSMIKKTLLISWTITKMLSWISSHSNKDYAASSNISKLTSLSSEKVMVEARSTWNHLSVSHLSSHQTWFLALIKKLSWSNSSWRSQTFNSNQRLLGSRNANLASNSQRRSCIQMMIENQHLMKKKSTKRESRDNKKELWKELAS